MFIEAQKKQAAGEVLVLLLVPRSKTSPPSIFPLTIFSLDFQLGRHEVKLAELKIPS